MWSTDRLSDRPTALTDRPTRVTDRPTTSHREASSTSARRPNSFGIAMPRTTKTARARWKTSELPELVARTVCALLSRASPVMDDKTIIAIAARLCEAMERRARARGMNVTYPPSHFHWGRDTFMQPVKHCVHALRQHWPRDTKWEKLVTFQFGELPDADADEDEDEDEDVERALEGARGDDKSDDDDVEECEEENVGDGDWDDDEDSRLESRNENALRDLAQLIGTPMLSPIDARASDGSSKKRSRLSLSEEGE